MGIDLVRPRTLRQVSGKLVPLAKYFCILASAVVEAAAILDTTRLFINLVRRRSEGRCLPTHPFPGAPNLNSWRRYTLAVFLCLCSPLLCSPLPCSTSPFLPYILGRIHLSTARAAHRRSVTIHRLSDLCRSSPLSRSDLLCDRSTTPTSGLRGTNTNTHRAVEADIRSPNAGSQKPEARSRKGMPDTTVVH